MPCDSSESDAAHIDLHRLFTACQILNISAAVKKVAWGSRKCRRGEWNSGEDMVNKEVERIWKGRWDNSRMSISWKEKNGEGKEEENRKDVATEHTSSQETYTLKEYCDHCCVCVCVCACHSRRRLYELSHSLFMMAPRWRLLWRRTTC